MGRAKAVVVLVLLVGALVGGWGNDAAADGTKADATATSARSSAPLTNADSHREALDLMADYPLFGMVTWDVRPLLEFKEGLDTLRAKLAEVQAAMAAGQ